MTSDPVIRKIPALDRDREPLQKRLQYDLSDYGFILSASLTKDFEVVPAELNDEEAFVFFYPKRDLNSPRYSLYNFHCFLKRAGTLEQFAHSLGPSVRTIKLSDTIVLGSAAKIYRRTISMRDLFEGVPQVINLIGGSPDMVIIDSHCYFSHRHNHYYSGMMHLPGAEDIYDDLRQLLFAGIRLV